MDTYKIVSEPNATPSDLRVLEEGLSSYDHVEFAKSGSQPMTIFLRDQDGAIAGGVHGNSGALWLYIAALWVADELRGMGYGTLLLMNAEREAVERGCSDCYLDTYNPRALKFYLKADYVIFGELENFVGNASRYFLRKKLA